MDKIIENIVFENYKNRDSYSHVKKIDLGNCYLIPNGYNSSRLASQKIKMI